MKKYEKPVLDIIDFGDDLIVTSGEYPLGDVGIWEMNDLFDDGNGE